SETEQSRLAREWQAARSSLLTSMANRARDREQSLTGRLDAQKGEEIKRLEEAIDQFRRTLNRALNDPELQAIQLRLFDEDERSQMRRDVEGWRSTLDSL